MLQIFILFVIGFVLLKKGADLLVEGASSLAKDFKISDAMIGLTVVALGTTAPELVVGITSSLSGNMDVSLGNVIGATIANFLYILGAASLFGRLVVKKEAVGKELPFFFFSVLAVFFLANDGIFDGASNSLITRIDGLILLLLLGIFLYYTLVSGRLAKGKLEEVKLDEVSYKTWVATAMVVGGAASLFLGGRWVVDGAVYVAGLLGLSQSLIGLTLVTFGTTLPDLATAITAVRKGKSDLAVGNVVGANILHLLLVLGICSFIGEINYSVGLNLDLLVSAIAAIILSVLVFVGKRNLLTRWEGLTMLFLYFSYIAFVLVRG